MSRLFTSRNRQSQRGIRQLEAELKESLTIPFLDEPEETVFPDGDFGVAARAPAEMFNKGVQRFGHVLIAKVPR